MEKKTGIKDNWPLYLDQVSLLFSDLFLFNSSSYFIVYYLKV